MVGQLKCVWILSEKNKQLKVCTIVMMVIVMDVLHMDKRNSRKIFLGDYIISDRMFQQF